ncbi:MAG: molybdopterin dinucleotide binding domain-containing protein [Candidatus Bathyarchaeia archaeon]
MEFTLITGRTINQGRGKEHGKFSEEYLANVAICEMNPEDMRRLNIGDGTNIRVTTEVGSVIVKARKSRRIKTPGVIFMPYGPWANAVLKPESEGTGMPLLKGLKANVEPTEDEVSNLKDLLIEAYGRSKMMKSEG